MTLKFNKKSTKPFLRLIKEQNTFGYFVAVRRAAWEEGTTVVDKLTYNQCSKNIICGNRRKQELYKEGLNR